MTFHHQIIEAENDLKELKRSYLRRHGWKETSHTPGAYWLWGRNMDDVNAQFDKWNAAHPDRPHAPYPPMLVPEDMAMSITLQCIDEQKELATADED